MGDKVISAYSAYGAGGASTRVRLYDWLDHLGVEAERHAYLGRNANPPGELARHPLAVAKAESDLWRRSRGRCDDVAIVSREASPLSTGRLEAGLLERSARGVFDFDDAIYLPATGARRLFSQGKKARRCVTAADVVIAGNDMLADWASQYARDVVVIPSCIEPTAYATKTTWDIARAPRLVWLGSPATERYLDDIAPALEETWRTTGAVLTVISGPASRSGSLDQRPDFVRCVEWSPQVVRRELVEADVALAPLRDDAYARGKCAYKLLQYAASGLPMVGAPVGANALALERFEGIPVTSHEEWVDGLGVLISETAHERAQRARRALEAVKKHYAFDVWADEWCRAVGISLETTV